MESLKKKPRETTKTKANAVARDIKYRSFRVSSGMISTVTAVAKSKRRLSISIAMQKLMRHSFTIIQNGHKVHSIWQPTFLYFPNLLLNQGHAHTHTHQKQHVYKWSAELVVLIEKQEFLGIYKKIMLQSSLSTLNTGNSWYHMEETHIFQHLLLFKQLR